MWLLWLLIFTFEIQAQADHSPYAAEADRREIKSLSADERLGYMEGHGMGLARAAELNGYPGPLHVLELAEPLRLTAEQKKQTEKIRAAMLTEAKQKGKFIVDRERELDRLFSGGQISEEQMKALAGEIARMQGELRLVHLRAHLEMKRVLRPDQVKRYNEMRGYHDSGESPQGRGHGGG